MAGSGDQSFPFIDEDPKQPTHRHKVQHTDAGYGGDISVQSLKRQEDRMDVGDDTDASNNEAQKAACHYKDGGARPKTNNQKEKNRNNTSSQKQEIRSNIELVQTSVKLNHQMPVFQTWRHVNMSFSYKGLSCQFDATHDIDPCKLQFAMESPKQAPSFAYRLKKWKNISIVCLGPGSIVVNIDSSNYTSRGTLISEMTECINNALTDITVTSVDFDSEQQAFSCLENLDQDCKSLFNDMIVGLFLRNMHNLACLSLVGTTSEITSIEEDIRNELGLLEKDTKQKQSIEPPPKPAQSVAPNSVINNPYIDRKEYDIPTVHFLDQIGFKKELAGLFPHVKCAELETDNRILEFEAPTKLEVEKAENELEKKLQRVIKERIALPSYVTEFFKDDTVFLHLQKKLRPIPASLEVTDCVVIWADDKNKMNESKDIVLKSYTVEESQAQVFEHENLNSLLLEAHGKVKIYLEKDGMCHICYLNDMQGLVKQMKEVAENDVKNDTYDEIGSFDETAFKLMSSVDIWNKLKETFPGVTFILNGKSCEVKVTSKQRQETENAFKELRVYERRLKKVSLNGMSQNIQQILQRAKVETFVAEQLKRPILKFLSQENEFICIGMDLEKSKDLQAEIESCFVVSKRKREFLDTEKGKKFQNQHSSYIFREDLSDTLTTIICTKDLEFKLNILFEECVKTQNYEKRCKQITSKFLQTHGKHFVKEVEKKHNVKIVFEDSKIVLKGNFSDGEKAMQELLEIVPTRILCLKNGERYQAMLASEELKTAVDDIAEKYECCCSMTSQTNDRDDAAACLSIKGVDCCASWISDTGQGNVSVAIADFESTDFDVVLIPVDVNLKGRSLNLSDGAMTDYGNFFKRETAQPLQLGEIVMCQISENLGCRVLAAIAVQESSFTPPQEISKKKKAKIKTTLQQFFSKMLGENKKTIGIAVPSDGKDLPYYIETSILEFWKGNKDLKRAELYFCIHGEAGPMIEGVNTVVLSSKNSFRRVLSGQAEGIFKMPETSVEITQSPLFGVGGECLVVAVDSKLNLSEGYLSNEVSKQAGKDLQNDLNRRHSKQLKAGDIIMTSAFNLGTKGVKKLIFGFLPKWKKNGRRLKILVKFVQDCLMAAEQSGCKSVVFPALGTGNLKYPKRDVAKVMLNGIENYLSETMTGKLDYIFISTPTFKMDTSMFQLLVLEQKKRQVLKDEEDRTSFLGTFQDKTKLVVSDVGIDFSVVKVDVLQLRPSNEFLHVEFRPANNVKEPDLSWSNWKLIVACGQSLADLQGAMKCVIDECEANAVTSIYVYNAKGFAISFADQADTIVKSVQKYSLSDSKGHVKEFRYLSNVTIVTDETGFTNIENKLLVGPHQQGWLARTLWKDTDTHECVWTKESLLSPQLYLHIKLIGVSKDKVDAAKKDIDHLLQVNGNEGQLKMPQKKTDEVTAELNQGIVKYLKGNPEYFKKWKRHVENAYHVEITDQNGDFEMKVIGSFENILKLEKYLENGSLDLPEIAQEQGFEFEHNHYEAESDLVDFKTPIHPDKFEILMQLYSGEIQSLTEENKINGMNITDSGMYIKCTKGQVPHLKAVFFNMKNKLDKTEVKSICFESDAEFHCAEQECFAKCPKNVKYKAEKSERKIKIFGDQKSVTELLQVLHSEIDRVQKKGKKISGKEYKCKVSGITLYIYCADILESDVDCIVSATNSNLMCRNGVAKSIAEKAGPEFLKDCKETVENDGELVESECRVTRPGKLKFSCILNVHSLIKYDTLQMHPQLLKIQKAISNALEKAEELQLHSIAIPFICTGVSGFDINKCAQQYIRGIEEYSKCSRRGNITEVHFVDRDKQKVETVSKIFKDYVRTRLVGEVHFSKEFDLKFPKQDVRVRLGSGRIGAASAVGIIAMVDKGFKSDGNDVTDILELSSDTFKHGFQREQGKIHPITSVTAFSSGGSMNCQYILFAVPPLWEGENFERDLGETIGHIFEESSSKEMASLALPLPCVGGNKTTTKAYCRAIVGEICTYFKSSRRCLKEILIVLPDERMMSEVNREIEKCFEERQTFDRDTLNRSGKRKSGKTYQYSTYC